MATYLFSLEDHPSSGVRYSDPHPKSVPLGYRCLRYILENATSRGSCLRIRARTLGIVHFSPCLPETPHPVGWAELGLGRGTCRVNTLR